MVFLFPPNWARRTGVRGRLNGDCMALNEYNKYEQSEIVQKWLRENGVSIVVGIVMGLVGIFGWQQWRAHQLANQEQAGQMYEQVQAAYASGKQSAADALIDTMMTDFEKSPFTLFAVSDRARHEVETKQLDKAMTSLGWAEAHAAEPALKSLTQIRIAQVEFARGNAEAALATLDRVPETDYKGQLLELRGDALVKLGRADDARKAYQAAIASLSEEAPQRGAVQMKLDDLAVAGNQGA